MPTVLAASLASTAATTRKCLLPCNPGLTFLTPLPSHLNQPGTFAAPWLLAPALEGRALLVPSLWIHRSWPTPIQYPQRSTCLQPVLQNMLGAGLVTKSERNGSAQLQTPRVPAGPPVQNLPRRECYSGQKAQLWEPAAWQTGLARVQAGGARTARNALQMPLAKTTQRQHANELYQRAGSSSGLQADECDVHLVWAQAAGEQEGS